MKKADKYLSKKILCSILAAGVFGVCTGAQAASLNGFDNKDKNATHWGTDGNTVTAETVANAGSSKFVIGQGNISVQTNGSVGALLAKLKEGLEDPKTSTITAIKNALAQEQYFPEDKENSRFNIITGLVGGEGQIDYLSFITSDTVHFVGSKLNGYNTLSGILNKFCNIDTTRDRIDFSNNTINLNYFFGQYVDENGKPKPIDDLKNKLSDINNDILIIIGNKETEPVVIGAIGGDLSLSAINSLPVFFNGSLTSFNLNPNDYSPATNIIRKGNINTAINSGNVFGGVGASAAAALANIKGDATISKDSLSVRVTATTAGDATTTVTGNVNTEINGGANVAAFANGGLAAGIGGKAVSTVNGSTVLKVNSTVNSDEIEGVTIGLAGGGKAVSTLRGEAESTVNGSTSIAVNNGLSAGIIGGGVAAAVDASQIGDMIRGARIGKEQNYADGNIFTDLVISGITTTLDYVNEGGEATSKVEGDTNIELTGTTTAAGIIGGGVAAATHYYVGKGETGDNDLNTAIKGHSVGSSTANVTTGKNTININLTGDTDKGNLINSIKTDLPSVITALNGSDNSIVTAIDNLKTFIGNAKDNRAALGVIGGGVAAALDFAKVETTEEDGTKIKVAVKPAEDTDIAKANAKFEGAEINLKSGYVVGTLGGGAAVATNFAQASSTTEDDITVNLDGAEAVGIWGNGAALFTGSSDGGTIKLSGKTEVSAQNTTININSGSADGVYGGGIAIDDSRANFTNASVKTSGTSTINVSNGAKVNVLNYEVLGLKDPSAKDDYPEAIAKTATNVAISGGGIAAGGGAESSVDKSVININSGAQVTGDILGGGIAVLGYEPSPDNADANVGANVKESTINLKQGAVIDGNVYAGGAVDVGYKPESGSQYDKAKATVTTATVNLNGAQVSGQLVGEGLLGGEISSDERVAINSTLNVSGENTLALAEDKDGNAASKIAGFDNTFFAADSVTVVDGSLEAGNTAALIDAAKAKGTKGVITVADGARLDVSQLTADPENSYLVAANYDEKKSSLWSDDALSYDRTEFYAAGTEEDSKYSISYKDIDALTEDELENAISAFSAGFGRYNPQMRNIVAGYFSDKEGVKKNAPGAKTFLADAAQAASVTAAENGAAAIMMLGEASGVTSNTAAIARDIADSAALRLSFTQDRVTGDNKIDADGNVWAKYVRNKHDIDGMASSFGSINSSSDFDGVIIGADFAKKGKAQSAVAFTYGSGDSHGSGSSNDFDMWGVTLFGSIKNDDSNVIADIGFAKSSNELSGSAFGKRLAADRDLTVFSAGVRAEKLYTEGSTQIVPYAGLRYMSIDPSSYTSYYDGQKAFDYDPERQNVWTLPVGVSLRHEAVANGWRLIPQADLSYVWAFGDTDNGMDVTLAGHSSRLGYTVMDSGSWLGSVALEAAKGDWTCGLGYSYQKGSHAESNKWFVNVEYSF